MDDLRTVAAFVAVADLLHIGRAAGRLGVSPATASSRLRALEHRLGLCLVDRSHRCRIALTAEGVAVLPTARAALAAHDALETTAAAVREGVYGVVRVAVLGPVSGPAGVSEPVGDRALRELGPYGEVLADGLAGVDDGWRVEFRRMDRLSAQRAMAVGGIDCAIGQGPPLRLGPGALDRRPNRLERARAISIGHDRIRPTSVTWRASWAARDTAFDLGAARIRDRLAATARGLAQRVLDERFPRAAARRRATVERKRRARGFRDRLAEDTRRFGREVALRRAHAEDRRGAIERYEAALAAGDGVGLHVLIDWMVATRKDDDPPKDRAPENAPPEDRPPENAPPEDRPPENDPPEDRPPENAPPEDRPPEDDPSLQ